MTGLVLNLSSIKELISPPQKQRKFLPGESRANCGVEGFRDLRPREAPFHRESEPVRNLTPPRFEAKVAITEDDYISPWQLETWERKSLIRANRQCLAEIYINRMLESLHAAGYQTWRVGGWSYSQATSSCWPPQVPFDSRQG